jgi:hypothetical protein
MDNKFYKEIKKLQSYKDILKLGFFDLTSEKQKLNGTIKFVHNKKLSSNSWDVVKVPLTYYISGISGNIQVSRGIGYVESIKFKKNKNYKPKPEVGRLYKGNGKLNKIEEYDFLFKRIILNAKKKIKIENEIKNIVENILSKKKMQELGREIMNFLKKYGGKAANYDPQYDSEDEMWNSPDASMMYATAQLFLKGIMPKESPWSSYFNGGYKSGGREIHDKLLDKISDAIKEKDDKKEKTKTFGNEIIKFK